jgi:hypothetical protein
MGRYINCKIGDEYKTVWKYAFAIQNSEMYRIASELGIGEYEMIRYTDDARGFEYVTDEGDMDVDGDILVLSQKDIPLLQEKIELLKIANHLEENKWFIAMVESIVNFMNTYPEQETFILEGEF